MIATIIPDMRNHYPVLLSEIISIITPQYGGTFIDCTFGQGGYSKKILNFAETKVIALDRDLESQKKANIIQSSFENRFLFKNIKFSQLNDLKEFGVDSDAPDLFSSEIENPSSENLLSSNVEEDELEIPAFLRRQKN